MKSSIKNRNKGSLRSIKDALISHKLLALAERSAKSGSWSWNVQTDEFYWSQGLFNLLGLDAARDVPNLDTWRKCLHPDDRDKAQNQVNFALRRGVPLFIQYRVVLPDGKIRWLDAYGDTAYDKKRRPESMSGFCIDSTDRIALEKDNVTLQQHLAETQRLEKELRKSRDKLELALSASGQGYWELDVRSGDIWFDGRACGLLGRKPERLPSTVKAWDLLHHPEDRGAMQSELAAYLQNEAHAFQVEYRVKNLKGHWVWLMSHGSIVERDAKQKPVRVAGTLQDVSKFKHASDEGARLIERFGAFLKGFSATPVGLNGKQDAVGEADELNKLSRRQRQILLLIARGMTSSNIAKHLRISTGTAISHRRELMKKLDLHNAAELTRFALRHRLIVD